MKIKVILLIFVILFVIGCKSQETTSQPAVSQPQQPSSESLINQVKEASQRAISNITQVIEQPSQTVFVPVPTGTQADDVVNKNYIAPCMLAKYKGLNAYCEGKNFWHNQSTLLSWYVPYAVVLFLLLIFIIWFVIWLWKQRG